MNAHPVQINEDEIDLREIFKTLIRHKKKIIFFTLLFGIISAAVAYFMPNVYSASSTVEIGADEKAVASQQDILAMAMAPGALTPDTEIEIIKSRFVVANALKKVDFAHRYYQTVKMKERELYKDAPFEVELEKGFGCSFAFSPLSKTRYRLEAKGVDKETGEEWEIDKAYDFGQKVQEAHFALTLSLKEGIEALEEGSYRFEVLSPREAAELAQEKVTVSQKGKNSAILQISAEDNVPLRAKEFVNALAEAYIDQSIQRKTLEATMTLEFIDDQLSRINDNLQTSAANLEHFKKEINMVDLGTKAQGVVEKMSEYESKLAEVAMEEKMLASLYAQVQKGKNLEMLSSAGLNLENTGVPELIKELQEALLKQKFLLEDYTPQHPEVLKVTRTIAQLKQIITGTINTLKERVASRKGLLAKSIEEHEALLQTLPEEERILGGLQRKFLVNEKIYSYLLEKRAATAIAKASTVSKNRILDTALVPDAAKPVKPKRKLIVLVGLILGVIFGVFTAFVSEFLDDRIKEEEDVRKGSPLPLAGMIPSIKESGEKVKVLESPKSIVSEAFRTLRTNLQFMTPGSGPVLLAITSTVGGEGKTTVGSNLGAIISLTGKRTVVINLDMRKPVLHKRFGLSNNQGISSVLAGKASLESVILPTADENLDIIPSGPIPPNPSELIGGKLMLETIEKLKALYDVIIFDTPPVGLVTDAMALMKLSDVSLYVLRAGYSKKAFLQDINRMAQEHEITNLGLVLNDIRYNRSGYGYGYGYYEEDRK